ncbi:phage/plasmid replication protein, II/X family [Vibrio parahaemolyticus]|uniref:phage/plasmid replication protein, II/X family n=1 Tax=Vibrio parahaemolyticus TaxID=670 RepID=UPI00215C14BE|nr:phage/plasmid replication protein, II/X family [Vibrio parahaemolyticus]MCR9653235.1 phage/plasmid replication protein, II/X family [Vibrio parahaemolyticus]
MGHGKFVRSIESVPLIPEVQKIVESHRKNPVPDSFVSFEPTNPTLMIDWLSVKFFFWSDECLNGGNVISTTPDGEIEYTVDKHLKVEGSYDSRLLIRTERTRLPELPELENVWTLSVSGNPVKWFQGHNIFGTCDINNLIIELFDALAKKFGKAQPDFVRNWVLQGHYTISRVDINGMFELGSRLDVISWLSALEQTARTRHGTAVAKGNTVYFGKNSERWTLKFYAKGQEIESHKLPGVLQLTSLPEFANNKLRAELTLRTKELVKLGLNVGSAWFNIDTWELYKEYMGRVEMSSQKPVDDIVSKLPRYLVSSYALWKEGYCLKTSIPKNTFYRHRRELMEFGIDISIPNSKEPVSNVVPLNRVIEMRPAGIPDWAFGTDLLFEPRKLALAR